MHICILTLIMNFYHVLIDQLWFFNAVLNILATQYLLVVWLPRVVLKRNNTYESPALIKIPFIFL